MLLLTSGLGQYSPCLTQAEPDGTGIHHSPIGMTVMIYRSRAIEEAEGGRRWQECILVRKTRGGPNRH